MNEFNNMQLRIFNWVESLGWHNKKPLEYLALIGSEVGEATNEIRNDVPTELFGSELADICIRTMDLAQIHDIDLWAHIERKMCINESKGNYKNRLK